MDGNDFYKYYDTETYCLKDRVGTYLSFIPKKTADGMANLEREIRERLLRLKANIGKCGSYRKVRELGGAKTDLFLIKTRNLISFYLLWNTTTNIMTDIEDIDMAVKLISGITPREIDVLVAKASFKDIEEYAHSVRSRYVDMYFERKEAAEALSKQAA